MNLGLESIKNCPEVETILQDKSLSCAVVGNSDTILKHTDGDEIDKYDVVIRCNQARTEGYEQYVGSRTDIRILNTHNFWCCTPNWPSTESMEDRFGRFDRDFIYKLRNETIIIKKPIPEDVFINHFNFLRENNCPINHLNLQFHNICNSFVGGSEATSGLLMIVLAIKKFGKVGCYGFRFSEDDEYNHYFEKIKKYNQDCHHFDNEKEIMERLDAEGFIYLR